METVENKKQTRTKSKKNESAGIRVTSETKRDLYRLVDKINRKQFGRKIKPSEVVAVAVKMIGETQIHELQQSALSYADKIEMQYRDYVRKNGSISKDAFLGKLYELMQERNGQV